MDQIQWKRPWLAAILGTFVTGLGHIYLRRLQRALGWVLATVITSFLFVPTSALETMWEGIISGSMSVPITDLLLDLFPLFAIGAVSAVDAYLIAYTNNKMLMEQQLGIQRCPECGRPIDPDVSFCQWCATPRDDDLEPDSTER